MKKIPPEGAERVKSAARRIAAMIAEDGPTTFEEWGSAIAVTMVSMAQFVGTDKETFMSGVSANWDAWEDTPENTGGVQ